MPININKTEKVETPSLTSSQERSFDAMKPIDISTFENIADQYVGAKEYKNQIAHLETYVQELNRHNILIKRGMNGYEIATETIPETLLPKALVARLQRSLDKLYTNSYVVLREQQDIPLDKRRDISAQTNLKKEHVSTQLETAILNNLLYSDNTHATTVFSTLPTLDFKGVPRGADLQLSDVEQAIKKKSRPTTKEKQVLKAIEGVRAFGAENQNTSNSKEATAVINDKNENLKNVLNDYKKMIDSNNVSLATRSELGNFSQQILKNIDRSRKTQW